MKKNIVASIILTLSSVTALAEVKPYLGVSLNSFSINTSELSATDLNSGFSITSSNKAKDRGPASGITGGIILSDKAKLNFFHFSGAEKTSNFLTTTVSSISYDYSFNGAGVHRGWFLGGGVSSVEIKAEKTTDNTAGVSKASGALFRGGYEYLFNNNVFLEIGFNTNLSENRLKFKGTGSASSIELDAKMNVSNAYISLSYVF